MPSLAHDFYPHIFERIFAHAPYASLLALRAASRELRDRVDRRLISHIAIKINDDGEQRLGMVRDYLWTVHDGSSRRGIPRRGWHDNPSFMDAVRTVDLPTTHDEHSRLIHRVQRGTEERSLAST